jgi:hypothetical protein
VKGRSVVEKDVPAAGEAGAGLTAVEVPVRPTRSTRAELKTYGIEVVPLSVIYTPLGGVPRTRYTRVWLALTTSGRR